MGGILGLYLTRMFLQRTVASLLVLVTLLEIVDLFDSTIEILNRGLGIVGVLHYEALRLPGMIEQILPISALIGALLSFSGLAATSEMAALRATGTTIYRVVALLLPAAAAVAIINFAIADQIAPRSEEAFSEWWKSTERAPPPKTAEPSAPGPQRKKTGAWFRSGVYVIHADAASADGSRLTGVQIYRREPRTGRLAQRTFAKLAYRQDGRWLLEGVSDMDIQPTSTRTVVSATRGWNTSLAPKDVVSIFAPEDHISIAKALRALAGGHPAEKAPAFYATRVQRALAEPLGVLVMVLLAAPAALGQARNNQASLLMFSLGAGMLFVMIDGVMTALAQTNVLPPILGAWAGPILFAALGGAALVHLEG